MIRDSPPQAHAVPVRSQQVEQNKKKQLSIIKEKIEDCTFCNSCIEVCEALFGKGSDLPIKITADESTRIFHFDTDGSLSATDALLEALRIIEDKLSSFSDNLKNIKSSVKSKAK